jgi:hypothetical protein
MDPCRSRGLWGRLRSALLPVRGRRRFPAPLLLLPFAAQRVNDVKPGGRARIPLNKVILPSGKSAVLLFSAASPWDWWSLDLGEERFSPFEIARFKALREPAVDRGEDVAGFDVRASIAVEPGGILQQRAAPRTWLPAPQRC